MSLPKEVLVLTMFDLSRLDRAMAVRPHNLHTSLQDLTPTVDDLRRLDTAAPGDPSLSAARRAAPDSRGLC